MNAIVRCDIDNAIATITMDDGKRNVISPTMLEQLNEALDRAEQANAVVILTGREDVFSAGFDLQVLRTGVLNAFRMLVGGFVLARRLLAFPTPVVIACNGHAIAMGSFLLLSGDYRLGVEGDAKFVANEVEIGLTVPHAAIEICRQRLKPGHFSRAVVLSECYNPQTAVDAGFLDAVVPRENLHSEALQRASRYAALNLKAHRATKLRMRRELLKKLNRALRADKASFVVMGFKRALGK